MPQSDTAYVAKETLISIVINAVISAGFVFLVFGGRSAIPFWGTHGLAIDFVPQTFMIALMSTFVPSAIARRKGTKSVDGADTSSSPTRKFLLRCILTAIGATIVLSPIGAGLAVALFKMPTAFQPLLVGKMVYGASVAALITPFSLRMTLSELRTI